MATINSNTKYYNQNTKEVIDLSDPKFKAQADQLGPQGLADQGYLPIGKEEKVTGGTLYSGSVDPVTGQSWQRFVQDTPAVSGLADVANNLIGTPASISQGTEDLRSMEDNNMSILNSAIGSNTQNGSDIDATIAKLTAEASRIGQFTAEEEKLIAEAGEAARFSYEPYIQEAEAARKRELPSAIVRAGERGGFLNTQQAGVAALTPTSPQAGESFVGAGGRLSEARQTLDRNISLLRTKQLQAIEEAKAAQRQAIITGKREDFDRAVKLVDLAEQFKQGREDMEIKRANLALNIASEQRLSDRLDFDIEAFQASEARLNRTADLAESEFLKEVSDDEREQAKDRIKNIASSLIPINELSDEEITTLEAQAGLLPGTFEAFYESLQADVQRGILKDELDIEKKIADINNVKSIMNNRGKTGSSLGQVSTGFLNSKIENEARANAVDLAGQVRSNQITYEDAFNTLRTLHSSSQATDEALTTLLNQALGISAVGQEDIDNANQNIKLEPIAGQIGGASTPEMFLPEGVGEFGNAVNFFNTFFTGPQSTPVKQVVPGSKEDPFTNSKIAKF